MAERLPTPTGTDCWNRIGVWATGGASCGELAAVGHCHNCEAFVQTGRQMLDRELDRELIEEWTRLYSRPADAPSIDPVSATLFRVGGEWLSLPTAGIEEITDVRPVHRLPHRSGPVLLGVTSIRGQLHLAVSLAALLSIDDEKQQAQEGKRLIVPRHVVMRREGATYAFRVDDVLGIYSYHKDEVEAVPDTLSHSGARFVRGLARIADRRVGLLDVELVGYGFEQALA